MKNIYWVLIMIAGLGCRDKYVIPVVAPARGYLVVEGNVNSGNSETIITLTRTSALTTVDKTFEKGATVTVEGQDNSSFPLRESAPGTYGAASLNLNNSLKYRLHITTNSGDEYLSDYVVVKATPPIDSITWKKDNEGVTIFVNAHDGAANTRYYQWDYKETWEFHSTYLSVLTYNDKNPQAPFLRYIDSNTLSYIKEVYTCWNSRSSTKLLLGSTTKLSEDRVYLPIQAIPTAAKEISFLYSINVRQFALSKEAFEYLDKMRKNTENTGSIFDPQPSALQGNLHSVKAPAETVIGFFNVSSVQEQRKFIYANEVLPWGYRSPCEQFEIPNNPDSVREAYNFGLIPTDVAKAMGRNITSFYATRSRECLDCTLTGTNVKPSFWP